jgi:hypothetical protein
MARSNSETSNTRTPSPAVHRLAVTQDAPAPDPALELALDGRSRAELERLADCLERLRSVAQAWPPGTVLVVGPAARHPLLKTIFQAR